MRFRSSQTGFITGVRYYKGPGATGVHVGSLWTNTGTQLAQASFVNETPSGWQQVSFSNPVAITADVTYVISCFSPSGDYAASKPYFTENLVNPPITGLKDGFDGPNGLFMYTAAPVFPTGSFQSSNYWVDVVFSSTDGTGGVAPSVTTQPGSQTLCAGTIATFISDATGTPTPTVQWQISSNGTDWTNINGATDATLSFTVVAGDNGKQYRAVWTNSTSSVNSTPATLTVNAIPASPVVTVVNSCGSSVLTASSFSGSLLWSNGANTSSITVTSAGTYTVTQQVNGCISPAGSGTAAPVTALAAPAVTVVNNCGSSILTASGYTGSLMWSNGATTESITVTAAGTYTVTQKINGCISPAGSGTAAPGTAPAAPAVTVVNNCGNSTLTASGYTGTLLWSNGATTASITVTSAGTYTLTQKVNGCISPGGSGTAAPGTAPAAPGVTVVNNCGNSTLTASGYTGTLLWSNGATTASITVTAAGTYTVTQKINTCTSPAGSGTAAPIAPATPTITVANNCGSSILTASGYTGSLLWSNGATTASITVTAAGTYTVKQTVNGCASANASAVAAPVVVQAAPTITVANACGGSTLTANGYTGSLLWSNGATTASITVTAAGTYTVKQTVNGCASATRSATAAPLAAPVAPTVKVVNNCGNSVLTASGYTGTLLWSNGATTASITVTAAGTYTVTQKVGTCISSASGGIAAPVAIPAAPVISVVNNCGNTILTASGYTGSLLWSNGATTPSISVTTAGTYTVKQTVNGCTSVTRNAAATPGTALAAPKVSVVNNCGSATLTASGYTGSLLWSNGATTESITVTTSGTYTVTQNRNGCTSSLGSAVVNVSQLTTSSENDFNDQPIPAGRYIWFNSVISPDKLKKISENSVTFNVTNGKISFTASGKQYLLTVPDSRIRFDRSITTASTKFVNNVWETVVPLEFKDDVFMSGLAYRVPVAFPGKIEGVKWTTDIAVSISDIKLEWKWAAAVYTTLGAHPSLKLKPVSGKKENPYPNSNNAGTPENYTQYLVEGATGKGKDDYTGDYSKKEKASCSDANVQTRPTSNSVSNSPVSTAQQARKSPVSIVPSANEITEIQVMPNPSSSHFNLVIKGTGESTATVRILDMFGQVVETHQKIASNTILKVGHRLASGAYFAEITQGNQRRIVRLIKAN